MLSIPATKAFEIGSGFKGTEIPGSKHNDPFVVRESGSLGTLTNWSGGVQGGITNGEDVYFRCHLSFFKDDHSVSHCTTLTELVSNPLPLLLKLKVPPNMMELLDH